MPFTPAHTAIVLPLLRSKYCSATALIIGSMVPDFEYFFRMDVKGKYGHTIPGLFYFDLPVTVLLAFIFHIIVKRNLIRNLPKSIQLRLTDTLTLNFFRYIREHPLIFISSALIGASSHIFWDGFTHQNGYFAQHLWFYKDTYFPFVGVRYPLFYVLQYLSTVLGLFLVAIYLKNKKLPTIKPKSPQLLYWLSVILIAALTVVIRFLVRSDFRFSNFVVCSISGILLGVFFCGFINFNKHGKNISVGANR